jgi:sigma-B regulation protein RsbU (phosphoserine phosphatase)
MAYASAGHIPGALLNRSGEVDWIIDSTGVPLGLFPDATFATRHGQFRTAQILVLGTDGATETSDVDGREFGREGVLDYVRTHANETAQDIAAGVYGAARSFGARNEQRDDITSVIVKVTNSALFAEQIPLALDAVAG